MIEPISLAGDELGPDLLPLDELADCAETALREAGPTVLSYGTGAGYTPLRELIAEWFGVEPYRVVLTNGWLQGLGLLAGPLVRGRNVVAEYPINDRAERTLLEAGAVLVSVGVDESGFRVDELRQLLIQYARPVLVYTIPSFHNPTGQTLSDERRRGLVAVIAEQARLETERTILLEDDSFGLTRFEGERAPALFDLSHGSTVYSASFETVLAPGLRVAWFILPEPLAHALIDAANRTYISPVLPAQATVFEFLRRGALEAHLGRLREQLRRRRDALLAALEAHFGGASWTTPEGGFFVWLELPPGTDWRAVLARSPGVSARPGTDFSATANMLRLSYAAAAPDAIAEGVRRLADAAG